MIKKINKNMNILKLYELKKYINFYKISKIRYNMKKI